MYGVCEYVWMPGYKTIGLLNVIFKWFQAFASRDQFKALKLKA